mmetsp:Transcript_22354/g.56508  ORF Transcript_22354/g.56508 Transcript_22354/m.56508 type:complete len:242 (+) Transcript_22354:4225-4950(+)
MGPAGLFVAGAVADGKIAKLSRGALVLTTEIRSGVSCFGVDPGAHSHISAEERNRRSASPQMDAGKRVKLWSRCHGTLRTQMRMTPIPKVQATSARQIHGLFGSLISSIRGIGRKPSRRAPVSSFPHRIPDGCARSPFSVAAGDRACSRTLSPRVLFVSAASSDIRHWGGERNSRHEYTTAPPILYPAPRSTCMRDAASQSRRFTALAQLASAAAAAGVAQSSTAASNVAGSLRRLIMSSN